VLYPSLSKARMWIGGEKIMAKVSLELDIEQLARAIAGLPRTQQQQLWSLLATFEERDDPGAVESLRESEEDVRAGRIYSFEDVFGKTTG
jgi:hypothetical protein